jgi:hypothetical protein
MPVPAGHPPEYLLVGGGRLQWAQALGAHLNHLLTGCLAAQARR